MSPHLLPDWLSYYLVWPDARWCSQMIPKCCHMSRMWLKLFWSYFGHTLVTFEWHVQSQGNDKNVTKVWTHFGHLLVTLGSYLSSMSKESPKCAQTYLELRNILGISWALEHFFGKLWSFFGQDLSLGALWTWIGHFFGHILGTFGQFVSKMWPYTHCLGVPTDGRPMASLPISARRQICSRTEVPSGTIDLHSGSAGRRSFW